VSDTPADVTINLDTLEREHGPAAPFVAYLGGKRLVFEDPQEIPWQDLLHLDDPEEFARLCLPEGQREHFLKHKVEAWKMNALMRGFKEHYGMGSLGNDDA
jgi:hypothetical protein